MIHLHLHLPSVFALICAAAAVAGLFAAWRAARAARLARLILATQQEAALDGILVVDQRGRVLSCNSSFMALWGIPPELAGRKKDEPLLRFVASQLADPPAFLARVRELYAHERERSRDELRLSDGRVLDRYSAPLHSHRGEYLGRVWFFRDVTEERRKEVRVRDAERKYRALFESSADGLLILGEEGFLDCNAAALALYGAASREELIGLRPAQVAPELQAGGVKSADDAAAKVSEALRAGSLRCEWLLRRKNGEVIPTDILLSKTMLGGRTVVQITARDASARKKAEEETRAAHDTLRKANAELLAATQVKSRFLATMSHEIRTPLNAIIGLTGLLLDSQLGAQQRDFMETIRSSGEILLALINDILDFSKIEAERLELERHSFDLRQCVDQAVALFASEAARKGLELTGLIAPGTPTALKGDATRLRQILVNLIGNAVKFTDAGAVAVSVGSRPLDGGRAELIFEVRDTGPGVPAEHQAKLFQPFSQVDASTTRRYGGTGLGLAISARLCRLMGGDIRLESPGAAGRGAAIRFTVTVELDREPPPAPGRAGREMLAGKKALIVDDNEPNRKALRFQLEAWNMIPSAAASGAEALELLRAGESYDLALVDMQMPGMDGLALADAIRRLPGGAALPLLLLSSIGYREPPDKTGRFHACLTKPVGAASLFEALVAALERRRPGARTGAALGADEALGREHPLRVLVAEDNAVNQKVAAGMLAALGYRPDMAADGVEALAALARQDYDVVFMDVRMPRLDGLQATRAIRARHPKDRGPWIVAITANVMAGDRERYLAAGMDDYLGKPIRLQELAEALRRCPRRPDAPALVDPAVLAGLRRGPGEGGAKAARDAVAAYREKSERLVSRLTEAARSGDAEGLKKAARELEDLSARVGAVRVAGLCGDLERAAAQGAPRDAQKRADSIAAALKLTERELVSPAG